jgi:hypothetical protein
MQPTTTTRLWLAAHDALAWVTVSQSNWKLTKLALNAQFWMQRHWPVAHRVWIATHRAKLPHHLRRISL